ncbi:hypothetical protein P7D22_09665 [Lichenihabitans sp. Uapishka_5]|uniref:hypothetical protein n=1 Tax=Lichenihabitans sp. Uapishka_5 TaxID=3037302 RepID=UPI0029E81326|nr:hypothetical protein [Lichenihabitans sp. Uapishka_5]MDX7951435.1 hypothetical protein [Lichenihabitans sp. Uapishka_5]
MADVKMSDQAYAEFVRGRFNEAVAGTAPIIFTNRGTSLAKTVLEQLVTRANISLDIFTGCLSATVYDAALLATAADRLKNIRVLVGDADPRGSTALSGLTKEISEGDVKALYCQAKRTIDGKQFDMGHFAICDGMHVRVEENAADRSATVILNAHLGTTHKIADAYKRVFQTLWDIAEPLPKEYKL